MHEGRARHQTMQALQHQEDPHVHPYGAHATATDTDLSPSQNLMLASASNMPMTQQLAEASGNGDVLKRLTRMANSREEGMSLDLAVRLHGGHLPASCHWR